MVPSSLGYPEGLLDEPGCQWHVGFTFPWDLPRQWWPLYGPELFSHCGSGNEPVVGQIRRCRPRCKGVWTLSGTAAIVGVLDHPWRFSEATLFALYPKHVLWLNTSSWSVLKTGNRHCVNPWPYHTIWYHMYTSTPVNKKKHHFGKTHVEDPWHGEPEVRSHPCRCHQEVGGDDQPRDPDPVRHSPAWVKCLSRCRWQQDHGQPTMGQWPPGELATYIVFGSGFSGWFRQ